MISVCFTTHQRTDLLFEAVEPFLADDRINEIVITDDCSDEGIYNTIVWKYNGIDKVKIFRNENNLDCYRNKRQTVKHAKNDWVLLLDSDNIFSSSYMDRIEDLMIGGLKQDVVYQPEWARPHFNFQRYAGQTINKSNVKDYIESEIFQTLLNAMNYFVNREEFLRVWDATLDPHTSDSIFQNYNWLNRGNSIYVVPGLSYEHRIHSGSHYQTNIKKTPQGFHESIVNKLKALR